MDVEVFRGGLSGTERANAAAAWRSVCMYVCRCDGYEGKGKEANIWVNR